MAAPTALPFERAAMLERLRRGGFDLLVIGGGITGAGVALDAASRGLSVALVERDDFASGTSSKSSKLVHGGLRYLQQGDVRLVYEALRERQRLLRNAPHLVSVLPFLIPVLTKDGPVSKKIAKALRSALWMYDLTGGLRIGERHRRLGADAALAMCPTMPAEKLSSGFVYYDATADDARLTLTIARTAAAHGAAVVNRASVVGFRHDAVGQVDGVVIEADGESLTVDCRAVVSATGVWADEVRTAAEGTEHDTLRPAKGVHVTVPWDLVRNEIAVIISVPKDKRSLFLVPWVEREGGGFEHCYVGTTDTDFFGDLDDPQTNDDDLDYVLTALNHHLTTTVGRDDVTGVWAGLRPLVKQASSGRTADLSRRHAITTGASGVVTVTGGKLTTYREMAEDTVDVVIERLGLRGRSRTKRLRLLGADGIVAAEVAALIEDDPVLGEPLVPGLRYVRAEAVYAVRREMATTLVDVLTRRTRAHLQDRDACRLAAADVGALIAPELGWDADEIARQVAAYERLCDEESIAAGVPDLRHATHQEPA